MTPARRHRLICEGCDHAAVRIDPEELVGCHVFEVGTREGVPFVTFGTGPETRRQARLIIESSYEMFGVDPAPMVPPLEALMYLTVEQAGTEGGELSLAFSLGARLRVSSKREVWTSDEPWWLTDWYSTPF
jgi:hypothetical protein